jgi:3-deoxy-D-manno-octulosonic-acid transferase
MPYGAYRIITEIVGPALPAWLNYRVRRGKEDAPRLYERKGIASQPRHNGRMAWFHAASVGESLSILPLVDAVLARGWQAVVTTGTMTSARLLAERMPSPALHQYVPLDYARWVKRFLDHWKPDLVLWTESELWPNTLNEITRRKIPAVLINGRLSDRTFRGWRHWPGFARRILAAFGLVIAQSDEDKTRFAALGAARVVAAGNLKLAAPALPVDHNALEALRGQIGARPRWLAASIHPGEDAIAAQLHLAVKSHVAGLLTVIVPRHPQKGEDMANGFTALGLKAARRSAGQPILPDTDIYIADTMGELGLFYRLCDLAFMGKSLAVGGGQNPAEAAHLGCALLLGPDMSNFRETTADLIARGAAIEVPTPDALNRAVERLLQDSQTRARMGENARNAMARHANAVAETLAHLAPYLGDA